MPKTATALVGRPAISILADFVALTSGLVPTSPD
jgi:hypothetical protein